MKIHKRLVGQNLFYVLRTCVLKFNFRLNLKHQIPSITRSIELPPFFHGQTDSGPFKSKARNRNDDTYIYYAIKFDCFFNAEMHSRSLSLFVLIITAHRLNNFCDIPNEWLRPEGLQTVPMPFLPVLVNQRYDPNYKSVRFGSYMNFGNYTVGLKRSCSNFCSRFCKVF